MFAKLTGIIDQVSDGRLILDVNGVGYLVAASNRTLEKIGSTGDPVSLLIETIIREDSISLFGFADAVEKEWFTILCSVQGVGAKAALALLAVVPPEDLPLVISAEDKAMISRADGIGKKIATRIVTELKDKAGKMMMGQSATLSAQSVGSTTPKSKASPAMAANGDAVSALINLGYGRAEAFTAVTNASRKCEDGVPSVEVLIKESLKELSA